MDAEQKIIINESLHILLEGDNQFHLRIQKLAKLKKCNPEMYNMALKMLDSLKS